MIVLSVIMEITTIHPIPVMDAMLQITIKPMIRRINQLNFRPIVKAATHRMPGYLQLSIMTDNIFQFTAEHIMVNGINAAIAIRTLEIMPYLPVLPAINKEKQIPSMKAYQVIKIIVMLVWLVIRMEADPELLTMMQRISR